MAEPDSVNAQVFSFLHKDFLAVSATHGTAHLALFDQAMWDKYELATLAGPKFKTNTLIVAKPMPTAYSNEEDPKSVFGPAGDTIPALQDRGAVFLACHNAISEITAKLIARGTNPDHASHEAAAAELTNHLIDGIVLPLRNRRNDSGAAAGRLSLCGVRPGMRKTRSASARPWARRRP
jgi:hypothetical protein